MKVPFAISLVIAILLISCAPQPTQTPTTQYQNQVNSNSNNASVESTPTQVNSLENKTQPFAGPQEFGPNEFPSGYNPLTGQPAADPSTLNIPAVLVSISHFPSIARPQAGFSFAPFVYEYFITEGSTRHLAAFYGEFPEPEIPLHGDCEVRTEPITQTNIIVGNRVWHDKNRNGIQDTSERGIGGMCVNFYDVNNNLLQQTSTDSNGYYAFNVDAGTYVVEFVKPAWLEFTQANVGNEEQDSDADQTSGRTEAVDVNVTTLYLDAGLIPSQSILPPDNESTSIPNAEVGPVRSGRLLYDHIGKYYQYSCLIYASADPEVLAQIPGCATVPHTDKGGGAMLSIERMKNIAAQNAQDRSSFNYASNLYSDIVPDGGKPATELFEYWAYLNQSKWKYDAASESYWRYVDTSSEDQAGVFFNYIDRLNGRQVQFENVIVLFVRHQVIKPTIVEMHMELGETGKGFLFRNGQVFNIQWSTRAGDYEQETGKRRPIQFQTKDGSPIALKPGHTWVIIFDLQSYLEELSPASWRVRFIAPAGAK